MYVQRNTEALSSNYCCSGKAISTTYSECVFVGYGIQHAMRKRHTAICALHRCTTFSHVTLQKARFSKKGNRT